MEKEEFSLLPSLQFWLSYSNSVGKALITLYLQGKAAAIALHHQKRSFHGGIIERPWLDNRTTPLFAHFFPKSKTAINNRALLYSSAHLGNSLPLSCVHGSQQKFMINFPSDGE